MNMEGKQQSLKLMGEGSSPGGSYEKIKVTGKGKINGDVTAKKARIIGELAVNGSASIDRFTMTGKGKIDNALTSDEVNLTGELTVNDAIKTTNFSIKGVVIARGDVDLEKADIKGGLKINGLLNVGELTINLQVIPSKVEEIGGEKITVKSRSLLNRSKTLDANVIEGDHIYLESTTAKIVRGNHIEIGPDCHIEHVEYRSSYKNKQKNGKNIINVKQI